MTTEHKKRSVKFQIYRYNPDKDTKPYMQDITVELESTDRKLLDAMICQLRPNYEAALTEYQRLLEQKSALLRARSYQ